MFSSVIFNTAAQLFGKVVSAAIGFATTLLLAQALGVTNYGEFIKITAFVSLFYPAVDFGLNAIYLRDFKNQMKEKLSEFITIRLLLGGFWFLVASTAIVALNTFFTPAFSQITRLGVLIGSLALIGQSLYLAVSVYWQNRQRLDIVSVISVAGSVLFLLLTIFSTKFLSAHHFHTIWAVTFATSGVLLSGFLSWGTVIKIARPKIFVNKQLLHQLLAASWPLGLTLIFNLLYFRADTLILAIYLDNQTVGAYGLAYKFFEFVLTMPAFLMNSLYPTMIDRQTSAAFGIFFKKSLILILGMSMILSTITFSGANYLFLIKQEYMISTPILQILSLFIPIFFLTSLLMWLLILYRQQKLLLAIYSLTALLNIVFNFWLIPLYGARGAALITGASETLVLLLLIMSVKYLGLWKNWSS